MGSSLDATSRNALGSDLRVHIEASGLYTYPDVVIIRGSLVLDKNQAAMNPKILFEILSPTRQRYDLLGKFEHYRQIASLDEYVLVEQDRYSIDRHRRTPGGQWQPTRYQGEEAVLELASVGVQVPLKQIYAGVPFHLAERSPETTG